MTKKTLETAYIEAAAKLWLYGMTTGELGAALNIPQAEVETMIIPIMMRANELAGGADAAH